VAVLQDLEQIIKRLLVTVELPVACLVHSAIEFLWKGAICITYFAYDCFEIQNVMKDPWVNIGYEDDKLKPYIEPARQIDQKRIGELSVSVNNMLSANLSTLM
jgi:hypothetical protein